MLELLIGFGIPSMLAKIVLSGSIVLIGGKVLDLLLKKYVTAKLLNKWAGKIESVGYGMGRGMTLAMVAWGPTSRFWNQTLEPYFVLVLGIFEKFLPGLRRGLSSDNPSLKE